MCGKVKRGYFLRRLIGSFHSSEVFVLPVTIAYPIVVRLSSDGSAYVAARRWENLFSSRIAIYALAFNIHLAFIFADSSAHDRSVGFFCSDDIFTNEVPCSY
jgi:hypothetical protein